MTPADTAKVLAKAAAFDQRTIGRADIAAWHEALSDLDVDVALEAVTRHYRRRTDRLMPAHVHEHAAEIYRERRIQARMAREAIQDQAYAAIATDRKPQTDELIAELRNRLPDGDWRHFRRPEMLRADQARARALWAVPNPDYDPSSQAALLEQRDEAS